MKDLLQFNKERSIGEIISFAFMIYRTNMRNFWKGMITGVLPWIAGAMLVITPFIVGKIGGNAVDIDSFVFLFLIAFVLYVFGFIVLNTYVNEYIIAVKNNTVDQKPHFKEIIKATYKALPSNLLRFAGLFILYMLMSSAVMLVVYIVSLGMFLGIFAQSVIITGIGVILYISVLFMAMSYLCICTGPILFIGQYEKVGFFKSLEINFSYVHTRRSFWTSILVSLFGFLLMYVISINITQPIWIVYGVIEYNSGTFKPTENNIFNIMALVYGVLGVTWPLSSFIMMIIFGANYFTQKEKAVGAGLNERIENIGNQKDYDSSKLEAGF